MLDRVFVNAAELDLSVKDLREILDANAKENLEKFEKIANEQEENIKSRDKKIQLLEIDIAKLNGKLTKVTKDHEIKILKLGQLLGMMHWNIMYLKLALLFWITLKKFYL